MAVPFSVPSLALQGKVAIFRGRKIGGPDADNRPMSQFNRSVFWRPFRRFCVTPLMRFSG